MAQAAQATQALFEASVGLAKAVDKGVTAFKNRNRSNSPSSTPSTEPSSTDPSSPSSSNATRLFRLRQGFRSTFNMSDVRFEPNNSDLAFLLRDDDEPGTPQVTYIVDNLKEYGTKCIPLKVYVSALLRTWETALLIYLPFLYNSEQPTYSQTLILEISPFLLEGTENNISTELTTSVKVKNALKTPLPTITANSNKPLDFKGNVEQFVSFLKLIIYFKSKKDILQTMVKSILGNIPTIFTIILVAGDEKVYLRVDISNPLTPKIEYNIVSTADITTNNNNMNITNIVIRQINDVVISEINSPSQTYSNNSYQSYSNDRLTKTPPPRQIYTTFPMPDASFFSSFESIGKFTPDIFSFLRWVIEIKSHPKNTPILFVSHSNTMREFLSVVVSNLNYNYTTISTALPDPNSFPPSPEFVDVCSKVRKTNTWSIRFEYLGYNVTGFRHAQSCDNIYKTLSDSKSKLKKVGTLLLVSAKDLYYREKYGDYTNISMWGIFSTLLYVNANKDTISNFNDTKLSESGLLLMSGMDQQTQENINKFTLKNELTCGDISSRFTISGGGPDIADVNIKVIKMAAQKFVDTIPYTMSLRDMSLTARQVLSNKLYSYDSIFSSKYLSYSSEGCKISVSYIGEYEFDESVIASIRNASLEEVKYNVKKRRVYINIEKIPAKGTKSSEYLVSLEFVNPGGIVIEKYRKLKVSVMNNNPFGVNVFRNNETETETFNVANPLNTPEEKIKMSNIFQRCVSFLLGFDIYKAGALTYDTLYNVMVLYSNLLIRQLQNIYLLLIASTSKNDKFVESLDNTDKFDKQAVNLYGGKNNKKGKKNKKN
jgi:hypothetical protein